MTQLSDLVRVIARVAGMEEVQVGWVARHLREAGLISQGGRGRGGAKMVARDAANLLIGICSVGSAKEIPDQVTRLRHAICVDSEFDLHADIRPAFSVDAQFGDALEALIKRATPEQAGDPLSSLVWDIFTPTYLTDGDLAWGERFEAHLDKLEAVITSQISLYHPSGRIEVYIADNDGLYVREDAHSARLRVLLAASFLADRSTEKSGDRVVKTSISLKTILEVGRVLAS